MNTKKNNKQRNQKLYKILRLKHHKIPKASLGTVFVHKILSWAVTPGGLIYGSQDLHLYKAFSTCKIISHNRKTVSLGKVLALMIGKAMKREP